MVQTWLVAKFGDASHMPASRQPETRLDSKQKLEELHKVEQKT
jgi:hypothetical protein